MLVSRLIRAAFTTQILPQLKIRGLVLPVTTGYTLPILQSSNLPVIKKAQITPTQIWSVKPFIGEIYAPIYRLVDAEYTGEAVQLEQDIWNQQLRRDLLHRLVIFSRNYYRAIRHPTLTLDRAAGSGKKMRKQKGSGRARQGQKQKSGWWKGVKAHGRKVRSLRQGLPKKVRLQGLKVALTAALYDGKIKIIQNETLQSCKTKELSQILSKISGNVGPILMITGDKLNENFTLASRNIEQLQVTSAELVNILKIMESKFILITRSGLEKLTLQLRTRTLKRFPTSKQVIQNLENTVEQEKETFDPKKPLNLKFKVLREYLEEYEKKKLSSELNQYVENMPKTRFVKNRINSINQS